MRFDLKSSSEVLDALYRARPVHRISIWWNTASHTPRLRQLRPWKTSQNFCGVSPLSECCWVHYCSCPSVCSPPGNKSFRCALTDDVENNQASGSDTVRTVATQATHALVLFMAIMLGPPANCWELARVRRQDGLEVSAERVYGPRHGRMQETQQRSGSRLLIRTLTARSCLCSGQACLSKQRHFHFRQYIQYIFTVCLHHFVILSLNRQLCLWLQLEWNVWYTYKSKFWNVLKVLYMENIPGKIKLVQLMIIYY